VKATRLERLLKLIQALESGRSYTASDLAEVVGVSRRTVFRDLDLLSQAGISYSYDHPTKRYSIERVAHLPPVTLTHAEALSLMIATRYVMERRIVPDHVAATSAALKLESMLPESIRDHCGSLLAHTDIIPAPASDNTSIVDTLSLLQYAALKRVKVDLQYDSYYDGRVIEVTVHPYRVVYVHRGWYTVGFSEQHEAFRTFKIERVLSIKVLASRFQVDRAFNLQSYFGNAWSMIRGDKRFLVRIRFSPKVAGNVDEINWHRTQRTHFEEDGSLLFEVEVDGVDEIAWWVLGYGDQAEVLEPPELREIIVRRVRRLIERYESSSASASGRPVATN